MRRTRVKALPRAKARASSELRAKRGEPEDTCEPRAKRGEPSTGGALTNGWCVKPSSTCEPSIPAQRGWKALLCCGRNAWQGFYVRRAICSKAICELHAKRAIRRCELRAIRVGESLQLRVRRNRYALPKALTGALRDPRAAFVSSTWKSLPAYLSAGEERAIIHALILLRVYRSR